MIGAYGVNNRIFDIWTMLGFGVLGFGIPQAPIILGFILCPILETNLWRGLQKSNGSLLPFVTEPISCAFILITVVVVASMIYKEYKKANAPARPA